jgi:photosystem II stability/assembly factor-like uncharacterized protein
VDKVWAAPRQPGGVFAQSSIGLYRRDSGGAWSELRAPFADDEAAKLDGMLFDRTTAQVVYAFNGGKYWRSADGGRSWKEPERKEPGLRAMMRGDISGPEFKSLAQDPGDTKTFYAGAWSNDEAGHGVFKSTDNGKNWKPSGNGLPDGAVNLLRTEAPKTIYAVVEKEGVFRSRDGGGSWANAGSGLPGGEIHDLAIDPSTPTRLFAATEHGLFRSNDGGDSWRRAIAGLEDDDVEAVVITPAGQVFAGSFHGVFRSRDNGGTFTKMNGSLPNTDVRALALEAGTPGRLYAGIAGGSVWSTALPAD